MKKNNTNTNAPLFPGSNYYSKTQFAFPIKAVRMNIMATTALRHNDGITLLYFKSGTGTLIVNTKEYEIEKGFLVCLGAYHYFQISPSQKNIEVMQCRLSYDTFLYMAGNPYYHFYELTVNDDPLASRLTGKDLIRTEELLDQLVEVTNKNSQSFNQQSFLLCMRLMGILQKTHDLGIWDTTKNYEK